MKKPKISIIVPVYNAERYLCECLDSIKNQTFKDFEVICVNDGSTDGSLNILNEFALNDTRFIVISQKNGGLCAARATGYEKACGEYIAWVDADDFIEPHMYESMYMMANENGAETVICNYNFFPKNISRKEKWYRSYEGILDWRFVLKNTLEWNKIVKKDLLDRLDIVSLFKEVGEGAYSLVLISSNKIVTIDEELYNYRVGHESLSSNFKNIEWFKKVVDYAKRKSDIVEQMGYSGEWREFFYFVYLKYSLLFMVVAAANNDKKNYISARNIVKDNKLFSVVYEKYLEKSFSKMKLFVLKNFVMRNYFAAKLVSKVALR